MAVYPSVDFCAPPESPFSSLRPEQLSAICASPGFQILRKYLATVSPEFCEEHASHDPTIPSTWVLHRDILHAITMPVVQLFNQASALAFAALCAKKPEDLELAFRGDARSAFLWLQCFIAEEEDWCYTRGCPACSTMHILSTESTIRATLAATFLSSHPASTPRSPSSDPASPTSGPSLPDFAALLPTLDLALTNDPFWGPGHYTHILSRSKRLTLGIQDLISQCEALEVLVSSAPPSPTSPTHNDLSLRRGYTIDAVLPEQDKKNREIKLKKSRMAKRQMRLRDEQKALIMRMAWQCWSAVSLPAEQRMAIRAIGRKNGDVIAGPGRRRTMTGP